MTKTNLPMEKRLHMLCGVCAKDMVGSDKKRFGFRYRRVISFIKVIPKRKIFFKSFIEKIKIFL